MAPPKPQLDLILNKLDGYNLIQNTRLRHVKPVNDLYQEAMDLFLSAEAPNNDILLREQHYSKLVQHWDEWSHFVSQVSGRRSTSQNTDELYVHHGKLFSIYFIKGLWEWSRQVVVRNERFDGEMPRSDSFGDRAASKEERVIKQFDSNLEWIYISMIFLGYFSSTGIKAPAFAWLTEPLKDKASDEKISGSIDIREIIAKWNARDSKLHDTGPSAKRARNLIEHPAGLSNDTDTLSYKKAIFSLPWIILDRVYSTKSPVEIEMSSAKTPEPSTGIFSSFFTSPNNKRKRSQSPLPSSQENDNKIPLNEQLNEKIKAEFLYVYTHAMLLEKAETGRALSWRSVEAFVSCIREWLHPLFQSSSLPEVVLLCLGLDLLAFHDSNTAFQFGNDNKCTIPILDLLDTVVNISSNLPWRMSSVRSSAVECKVLTLGGLDHFVLAKILEKSQLLNDMQWLCYSKAFPFSLSDQSQTLTLFHVHETKLMIDILKCFIHSPRNQSAAMAALEVLRTKPQLYDTRHYLEFYRQDNSTKPIQSSALSLKSMANKAGRILFGDSKESAVSQPWNESDISLLRSLVQLKLKLLLAAQKYLDACFLCNKIGECMSSSFSTECWKAFVLGVAKSNADHFEESATMNIQECEHFTKVLVGMPIDSAGIDQVVEFLNAQIASTAQNADKIFFQKAIFNFLKVRQNTADAFAAACDMDSWIFKLASLSENASPGMGTLAACDLFFQKLENDPDEWLPEDEQSLESSNHSDEVKVEATTVNSALKRNHATVSKKEQPETSIRELQSMNLGIPDPPQPNSGKRARTEASTMEDSNMQERNHALPPSGNSQNTSTAFPDSDEGNRDSSSSDDEDPDADKGAVVAVESTKHQSPLQQPASDQSEIEIIDSSDEETPESKVNEKDSSVECSYDEKVDEEYEDEEKTQDVEVDDETEDEEEYVRSHDSEVEGHRVRESPSSSDAHDADQSSEGDTQSSSESASDEDEVVEINSDNDVHETCIMQQEKAVRESSSDNMKDYMSGDDDGLPTSQFNDQQPSTPMIKNPDFTLLRRDQETSLASTVSHGPDPRAGRLGSTSREHIPFGDETDFTDRATADHVSSDEDEAPIEVKIEAPQKTMEEKKSSEQGSGGEDDDATARFASHAAKIESAENYNSDNQNVGIPSSSKRPASVAASDRATADHVSSDSDDVAPLEVRIHSGVDKNKSRRRVYVSARSRLRTGESISQRDREEKYNEDYKDSHQSDDAEPDSVSQKLPAENSGNQHTSHEMLRGEIGRSSILRSVFKSDRSKDHHVHMDYETSEREIEHSERPGGWASTVASDRATADDVSTDEDEAPLEISAPQEEEEALNGATEVIPPQPDHESHSRMNEQANPQDEPDHSGPVVQAASTVASDRATADHVSSDSEDEAPIVVHIDQGSNEREDMKEEHAQDTIPTGQGLNRRHVSEPEHDAPTVGLAGSTVGSDRATADHASESEDDAPLEVHIGLLPVRSGQQRSENKQMETSGPGSVSVPTEAVSYDIGLGASAVASDRATADNFSRDYEETPFEVHIAPPQDVENKAINEPSQDSVLQNNLRADQQDNQLAPGPPGLGGSTTFSDRATADSSSSEDEAPLVVHIRAAPVEDTSNKKELLSPPLDQPADPAQEESVHPPVGRGVSTIASDRATADHVSSDEDEAPIEVHIQQRQNQGRQKDDSENKYIAETRHLDSELDQQDEKGEQEQQPMGGGDTVATDSAMADHVSSDEDEAPIEVRIKDEVQTNADHTEGKQQFEIDDGTRDQEKEPAKGTDTVATDRAIAEQMTSDEEDAPIEIRVLAEDNRKRDSKDLVSPDNDDMPPPDSVHQQNMDAENKSENSADSIVGPMDLDEAEGTDLAVADDDSISASEDDAPIEVKVTMEKEDSLKKGACNDDFEDAETMTTSNLTDIAVTGRSEREEQGQEAVSSIVDPRGQEDQIDVPDMHNDEVMEDVYDADNDNATAELRLERGSFVSDRAIADNKSDFTDDEAPVEVHICPKTEKEKVRAEFSIDDEENSSRASSRVFYDLKDRSPRSRDKSEYDKFEANPDTHWDQQNPAVPLPNHLEETSYINNEVPLTQSKAECKTVVSSKSIEHRLSPLPTVNEETDLNGRAEQPAHAEDTDVFTKTNLADGSTHGLEGKPENIDQNPITNEQAIKDECQVDEASIKSQGSTRISQKSPKVVTTKGKAVEDQKDDDSVTYSRTGRPMRKAARRKANEDYLFPSMSRPPRPKRSAVETPTPSETKRRLRSNSDDVSDVSEISHSSPVRRKQTPLFKTTPSATESPRIILPTPLRRLHSGSVTSDHTAKSRGSKMGCGCRTGCKTMNCSCRKAGHVCTEECGCKGLCEGNSNPQIVQANAKSH